MQGWDWHCSPVSKNIILYKSTNILEVPTLELRNYAIYA
jgi:hypothetical protein